MAAVVSFATPAKKPAARPSISTSSSNWLSRRTWALSPLLLSFLSPVYAASHPFDCKFTVDKIDYDLTNLTSPLNFTTSTPTPPTTTVQQIIISLCRALVVDNSIPKVDRCPEGTRVCMTMYNDKPQEQVERRVVSVVPIATEDEETRVTANPLTITMPGAIYATVPQRLVITLMCTPADATGDHSPPLLAYSATKGTLTGNWSTPVACGIPSSSAPSDSDGFKDGSRGPNDPAGEATSGFFMTGLSILVLALLAYFGIGIYYNYATYGARTFWDLIPHPQFWRELPATIGDLFRSRPGARSGYSALG